MLICYNYVIKIVVEWYGDNMEESKTKKNKYINEFPLIIMVVVAVIVIILVNVYLNFRPYKTIDKKGYAVLSENMTYNLMNNNTVNDTLNVGVVGVNSGDSIYKQVDSYYVGEKDKKEIDMDYPLYSIDGLTIYSITDNFTLIDRNFNRVAGYPGLSITSGILYNDGDIEPADDIDYIFAHLNNSVLLGLQTITIKTAYNEYNIPINSPIYFNTKYINYYVFDGEKFNYNRIDDIYYDSLIKIGDVSLTYEEFLLKMNLVKKIDKEEDNTIDDNKPDEVPIKQEDDKQDDDTFIKPTVSITDFKVNVYSIESVMTINDPSGVITTNPTFEIYKPDGKLNSRKKVSNNGLFAITGLNSNTEYNVVGTYKYKNKQGITMVVTFFEGKIKTKDISELEAINLDSDVGDRYSNKIEIKDLTILNSDNEALRGVKKIVLSVWKTGNSNKTNFNLSYSKISSLIKGKPTVVSTTNSLDSNTSYNYEIKFFDGDSNELTTTGKDSGVIRTTKEVPTLKFNSDINKQTNDVKLTITTLNKDDIYIRDYNYKLYSYSGVLIDEGSLNYENKYPNNLSFNNLDYDTNYRIIITGTYDLEDGKGLQEFYEEKTFTTASLDTLINAWYDQNTKIVTSNSIQAKIYIGSKTPILDKEDTEVTIYLKDKDGNDILDEEGNLKYYNTYKNLEKNGSYYNVDSLFEGLESRTEYIMALKIKIKQIEKDAYILKDMKPPIMTLDEGAYVNVRYKKLMGETLDLSFDVVDLDHLIDESKVNIEIYEGLYDNIESINSQYIYRSVQQIENTHDDKYSNITNIKLTLDGYSSDSYTIKISAKPYNGVDVEQVIPIKSNKESEDGFVYLIQVDRNVKTKLEMYQQKLSEDKSNYLTEINVKYNLGEMTSNLYGIDCFNGKCNVIGYITQDITESTPSGKFVPISDKNSTFDSLEPVTEVSDLGEERKFYKIRIKFKNENKKENQGEHKFYVVLEKNAATNLANFSKIEETDLNYLYILSSLDYTTEHDIYNISSVDDLYSIKLSKENKHYVVTENLDLKKEDGTFYPNMNNRFYDFEGSIDFQGYKLTLYKNNDSSPTLFYSVSKTGVLKNALVYYELDYAGVIQDLAGLVQVNRGTIENFVIHVKQNNTTGSANKIGLLARSNYGTLKNFVIYLDTDIYTYGVSSLVSYYNYAGAKIKYGAVISNNDSKIYLKDITSSHGTFTYYNEGVISNVYNLTDVLSTEENYVKGSSGIAFISKENRNSSTIYNTLSVATSTHNSTTNGPSIYSSKGKVSNNYYVDTNSLNYSYRNSFNKKISKASLRNAGVLDVILNSDSEPEAGDKDPYSITSGYYPIVNMSEFMKEYQVPIEITYELKDSTIDIISTEAIKDNREDGVAKVRVYISNPNKLEITNIKVDKATAQICTTCEDELENGGYDENYQISNLILTLTIDEENEQALSNYDILSMTYKTSLGDEITKSYYTDSNPRIIDITLYKRVASYEGLISAINSNSNIYMLGNISLNNNTEIGGTACLNQAQNETYNEINSNCLPKLETYSAKFDGNQHTIDFGNNNIKRGYFFYGYTGELSNLQVKNMKLSSSEYYIGFIRLTTLAKIDNVDLTDLDILADRRGINNTTTVYLGSLTAYSTGSEFDKISVNNATINKDSSQNGKLYRFNVGGIIGYGLDGKISNSYSYNLKFNATYDTLIGYQTVGGIIGYASATYPNFIDINNCYSTGKFDTELSNVGGIAGTISIGKVRNSYSSMTLFSQGSNVGGIVGNYLKRLSISNSISNNLFVGTILNPKGKPNYDSITYLDTVKTNNFTIDNVPSFTSFTDVYNADDIYNNIYLQNGEAGNKEYLPYLSNSSFVEQNVKDKKVGEKSDQDFDYSIEYAIDEGCLDKLDSLFKEDNDYKNACATSAILKTNKELYVKEGKNKSKDLEIKSLQKEDEYYRYEIKPTNNVYYSIYEVEVENENRNEKLTVKFFKHIESTSDWDSLNFLTSGGYDSKYQNILLLDDIKIEPDGNIDKQIYYNGKEYQNRNILSVQKRLDNFYGNNKTISVSELNDNHYTDKDSIRSSLIYWLDGTMKNVKFNSIKISGQNSNYSAIVRFNNGTITNCDFKSIDIINYANVVGIVGLSNGYIYNVTMDDIRMRGRYYVGGLVGYSTSEDKESNIHIKDITASNVTIEAYSHLGGIAGYIDYFISDIKLTNITIQGYEGLWLNTDTVNSYIRPRQYVGGIVGYGDCVNCTLNSTNDKINIIYIDKASHVGGITGTLRTHMYLSNYSVENLLITSDPNIINPPAKLHETSGESTYVGGTYGYGYYGRHDYATNVVIASTTSEKFGKNLSELTPSDLAKSLSDSTISSSIYEPLNANIVGGIGGFMYSIQYSYLKNSFIYAKKNTGGMAGYVGTGYSHATFRNVVSNSFIAVSENAAGGILGKHDTITDGPANFMYNIVLNTKISSKYSSGGIIGYINNSTDYSQNISFSNNLVEGCIIEADSNEGTAGGLIGKIYKTPQSQDKKYNKSLFYGTLSGKNTGYGFGQIENLVPSASYVNISNAFDLSKESKFMEYSDTNEPSEIQINTPSDLNIFVGSQGIYKLSNIYFPVFVEGGSNPQISDEEKVKIPNATTQTTRLMAPQMRMMRNYAVAYSNPVKIKYDVYASDVDKINIEFSNIDQNSYFYYEIGDYKSDDISINNRVYTISYDYKSPIKIYVSNGSNYKTSTIEPSELSKKISLVGDSVYYINNGILYGEENSIMGSFINLYNNKVLTSDNSIYYIDTKEYVDSYVDYSILESVPLYSFIYNEKHINTYYNFTDIDGSIQNYQVLVKNGVLSIIDSSLDNKKNSYIIDNYNNNEIQIILDNKGELYSLKNNIKYPSDLVNKDIEELFTDLYSSSTIAVIRYKNEGIYAFNYQTGELVFTNITKDKSFLEYIKSKLSEDSREEVIKNLSKSSNYKNMEKLKIKIEEISISDAKGKITGNNSITSSGKNYTMVYNANTKKYDIYNLEEVLTSPESITTENDKINSDYELVEFYNTSHTTKQEKSLSGIIIFTLSIVSIFGALYLLINRKRLRGVS